ncbi:carboxyl-terminal processing protease [Pedobacter sp. CG_S7]|uniref:S41 family peptidase n=1 Tax=Pedobacter sp. CG_S7 TaxID=3143930 RepID=UPI003391683E
MISAVYKLNKSALFVFGIALVFSIAACKKDDPVAPVVTTPSVTVNRAELTKDSIFLYAKQVYFWNDALPTYEVFKPRNYTTLGTDLDNYDAELFAITQFKINSATGKPFEYNSSDPNSPKYSYITDITTANSAQSFVIKKTADLELDGTGYDLGFYSFQAYGSESNFSIYVSGIYNNSPAAKAGITRGAIINKVNGKLIGTNFTNERPLVINILLDDPSSVTISGLKSDGTPFNDVVLTKVKYTASPIFAAKTFTAGNKKIGYLALAQFSHLENNAKTYLDAAFSKFVSDGVTDLIVDLRYNGGGYVNTAEYLINLIAPASVTGSMFKEYYNATMQANKATILSNQLLLDDNDKVQDQNRDGKSDTYADIDFSVAENTIAFSKKGNLANVANVVFLVSGGTASASELVINSLKPHVNVKIVGKQTYGKPVGFFPIRLENKYDLYLSMFETKNSRDEGGYFAGFTPDVIDVSTSTVRNSSLFDDATHDFGDPAESYTKSALGLLAPATAATSSNAVMTIRGKKVAVAASLGMLKATIEKTRFIGMVENRYKIK